MEVSALKPTALPGPSAAGPLLRLQSDERLIALTRRGQQAAFEALFSRYHARLLAFCRHMLGSKEDAEDVLQEVFAAAFNAILADEREINVRPWLYRIARNRSLNHLRKATAIGVDSMDVHFADHGLSTGEKVMRRESFRQLIGDVQRLPETQRSALLLREIDALSYEQIAQAMETTVPSVKSLLVRARISLAEAAEARALSCDEVRAQLGEVAEGLIKLQAPARRHLRDCERCRAFRKHLKDNNSALAAILPIGPLVLLKKLVIGKFGSSAGGAHVAGGATATATVGASAASAGAGGGIGLGGLATAGAGAMATKAAATLAAAALVTAGAVEAGHVASHSHHSHQARLAATSSEDAVYGDEHAQPTIPTVASSVAQPVSAGAVKAAAVAAGAVQHRRRHRPLHHAAAPPVQILPETHTAASVPPPKSTLPPPPQTGPVTPSQAVKPPVTQVTTETTQLPSSATSTTTSTQPTPTGPPATTSTGTTPETTTPAPSSPPPSSATTGGTEAAGESNPTATTSSSPTSEPSGAPQTSTTSSATATP